MYELWHVIDNEPLFLLKREPKFDKIYEEFTNNIEKIPCIIVKNEYTQTEQDVYIYESPDNGKTVYKRKFGDYKNKILVNTGDLN